ncbi:hypothetical protein J4219_07460 [Candidatus Woesearchaeota archaeon]|nr:hypothetical protein [Candidatus Woesearchaeota archaeon]
MKVNDVYLMLQKRLSGVLESLRTKKTVKGYTDAEFLKAINELENIARDERFSELSFEVLGSSVFKDLAKETRSIYELFEEFCETRLALSFIKGNTSLDSPQIMRTFEFAKEEGQAAGMDSNSRVIFIGSGPFPESALAYAQTFGCSVTCVDIHPEAVILGEEVALRSNLGENIKFIHGDARDVDYRFFTHIVVAVLAVPKKEILSRVAQTCQSGAIVICRNVRGFRALIYEPILDLPLDNFYLHDLIRGAPGTIVHSAVLRKITVDSMPVGRALDNVADGL